MRAWTGVWAIGDCAAVPDPRSATAACPPTAQHAVRQGPVVAHNIAAELGVGIRPRRFKYKAKAAFVNLGRYKAVGQLGQAPLPRLSRLVDGPHLPHEPDPGPRARSARSPTGPSACRSPRHRRGRLDRPPAAAARRGLRPRRHARPVGGAAAPYFAGRGRRPARDRALVRPRDRDHRPRPRAARSSSGSSSAPCCPVLGLIAVILYRYEQDEPERRCPAAAQVQKIYVQVCPTLRRGPLPAGPVRGAPSGRGPRALRGLSSSAQPGADDRVREAHPVADDGGLLRVAVRAG